MSASPEDPKSSDSSQAKHLRWWRRIGELIPVIRSLSVAHARLLILVTFFASLAIAATQMLAPGWIWQELRHVTPPSLTANVSGFWRPIVLHGDLYRPRFNREVYAISVSRDGTVWAGGEQGFLGFSKDRGETWKCFDFDPRTGGFITAHDCGEGSNSAGLVASNSVPFWTTGLPKVYAAQSRNAQSSSKTDSGPSQFAATQDDRRILLKETSHNFGPVELNAFKTWDVTVSGTPFTRPQNITAAIAKSPEDGFRVLGSDLCKLAGASTCTFSIEFLPLKPIPYESTLTLKSTEVSSSATTLNSRSYTISLIGSGQGAGKATQAEPGLADGVGTQSTKPNPPSSFTRGDIIYLDSTHLVMANGDQPQLLVRTKSSPENWVHPGTANVILDDGSTFYGLPSNDADPNRYLEAQKSCPAVTAGRSFVWLLNQMLPQVSTAAGDCGAITNDPGTHINALASGDGTPGFGAAPVWTGYAAGGRPGRGMVYRIDSDSYGRRIRTPLTHDAAADALLLPIAMKLPAPWFYLVVVVCLFIMGAVAMRPQLPERKPGIEAMAVNDRPLEPGDVDAVRLRTVADGMSRFFRNPSTRAPLVLCINGSWGSGKSSLMNLLADDLQNHYYTVIPFNAWHHQSEDQILASLLQSVRNNALRSPWTLAGAWTRLRIFLTRWPERWFVSVVFGLATVWTAMLAYDFLKTGTVDLSKIAAFIPAFLTTLVTLRTIAQGFTGFLANPASLLATTGKCSKGDLEEQTTLRERFARDFATVTRVLGNGKLVLLIDDLDRCSPDKIRDIVEAINFLVTAGECYIVLGMARNVVEYYLGQSFAMAIKTMPASLLGLTEDEVKIEGKRESAFANVYLQKLIQLQFNLLPLSNDQAITLLQSGNERSPFGRLAATPDYTSATRLALKREDRLRSAQHAIQRWFLPVTGTLLLSLSAFYTTSLQNSANWVQQQIAPLFGKPTPKTSEADTSSIATASIPRRATEASASATSQVNPTGSTSAKINAEPAANGSTPSLSQPNAGQRSFGSRTATFPLHDANQALPAADVQQMRTAPGAIQVLLIVMVLGGGMWLLAQWWLIARPEAENAQDSKEFLVALSDWAPALLAMYKTPRGLKQYLNNVRFLAMLQRSQRSPADSSAVQERPRFARRLALWIVARRDKVKRDGILRTIQAHASAGFNEDSSIPDELLVALAALNATKATALDTFSWLNSEKEFGAADDSIAEKIREALNKTAGQSQLGPDPGKDQLRALLKSYQAAFFKLNGQTE